MPSKKVRLAILGTGGMARLHVGGFREVDGCEIVAAADIVPLRAAQFAETHGIPKAYASKEELLQAPDIDAISIVTPDASHAALALACLEAGKHVLCEKPLATSHQDALAMVEAAKRAGTINMVHFSYRNYPALHEVKKIVEQGEIGELRHVEGSYLQSWLTATLDGGWQACPSLLWRLSSQHGSKGVLRDVGVHLLDFVSYPVGPIQSVFCRFMAFQEAPRERIGEYFLDANDSAVINVVFVSIASGTLHTSRWAAGNDNRIALRIFGTKGGVEFDSDRGRTRYRICSGDNLHIQKWEELDAPETPALYRRFIQSILTHQNEQPDFQRGAKIQRILDACFESDAVQHPVSI